jgi:hypothetical protein
VPAGVPPPPPPPPLLDELPPPQAGMKTMPAITMQSSRTPSSFFRRELRPAPNSVIPPMGSNSAYKMPVECGARDAFAFAVVLMVSVEVPEPGTEVELNEHVGAGVPPPVMLLQARLTLPLKLATGVMVMVEVADPPAETVAGESAVAVIAKSGVVLACTTRLTEVVWLVDPEVPVMVTVDVPPGVAAVVEMVRVEVAGAEPGVTDGGLNEHVAPFGRPAEHDSETALLKPFSALTEMVEVADPPAETVAGESAVAVIAKSGVVLACTTRLTEVVWLIGPVALVELPVRVMP